MPKRNINLTDRLDHFVERQVSSGRYRDASEMAREGLRLLENREQERRAKLKTLRQAAEEGFRQIDQGEGIGLTGKNAVEQFIQGIEAEVKSKGAKKSG